MDNADRKPLVISPADLGPVEAKPQPPASASFAGNPSPPEADAPRRSGTASVLWIVVPAVVAVMTAAGFLMCGGVFFLLTFTGSSNEVIEPQSYAVYSDPTSTYSSDSYDAPVEYVPTAYAPAPTYEEPDYVAPTYVEPTYTEPAYAAPADVTPTYTAPVYVEPTYTEPAATPASAWTFDDPGAAPDTSWSFDGPGSDLAASIAADEEELVKFDAAILAARVGEAAGEVEAQDGETAADQLFGLVFSVGSDAVEQQLLAERAVVQARLDANRAELVRQRGY
jgi:hypothetical protein